MNIPVAHMELRMSGGSDPDEQIATAQSAVDRGDIDLAAEILRGLHTLLPRHSAAYVRTAQALVQQGQVDHADDLLAKARTLLPQDISILINRAWIAHNRGLTAEAVSLWRTAQEQFPDHAVAYTGMITSLRAGKRNDEAEAAASVAMERFPGDPAVHAEAARAAMARGDWQCAADRWQFVRDRFQDIAGYFGGAHVMTSMSRPLEAEQILAEGLQHFPTSIGLASEYARFAETRQDWPETVIRWQQVRNLDPNDPNGYLRELRALQELRQYEIAERLASEACARFPSSGVLACRYGWIEYRRHQWEAAERIFADVRQRFPSLDEGYTGGAAVLRGQGRLAEADAILDAGTRALPDSTAIFLEYARLPVDAAYRDKRDWPETYRRLDELRRRFPDFRQGWRISIEYRKIDKKLQEAEALADEAVGRFPDDSGFKIDHARLALDQGRQEEALERFSAVTAMFPNQSAGYVGHASALGSLGRFDEAEALLQDAVRRFTQDLNVCSDYAALAGQRHDWVACLSRWEEVQRRFPHVDHVNRRVFETRMRLLETGTATDLAEHRPETSHRTERQKTHDILMDFESLGGTALGCEFGLVQREFGAEPLGLLRWADITPDQLVAGLLSEFEGVGAPDNTELLIPAGGRGEYGSRDKRIGMRMHTFVRTDDVGSDVMIGRVCRRLRFLKGKLLNDLRAGSKIFVYKIASRNLQDDEIEQLHSAMRGYGENVLLYVRYEDDSHPNGTVELVRSGLMIGYIDRFGVTPSAEMAAPATASWVAICEKAHALWERPT